MSKAETVGKAGVGSALLVLVWQSLEQYSLVSFVDAKLRDLGVLGSICLRALNSRLFVLALFIAGIGLILRSRREYPVSSPAVAPFKNKAESNPVVSQTASPRIETNVYLGEKPRPEPPPSASPRIEFVQTRGVRVHENDVGVWYEASTNLEQARLGIVAQFKNRPGEPGQRAPVADVSARLVFRGTAAEDLHVNGGTWMGHYENIVHFGVGDAHQLIIALKFLPWATLDNPNKYNPFQGRWRSGMIIHHPQPYALASKGEFEITLLDSHGVNLYSGTFAYQCDGCRWTCRGKRMSKFDLRQFVLELNQRARSHPIGSLQQMRAELGGRRKSGDDIFRSQTIFDNYAFHYGGRSELQFNIGFDGRGNKEIRSGVAFSFETSRSFPNLEPLIDKVRWFNDFVRMNPNLYSDMEMWYWRHNDERADLSVGPIPFQVAEKDVFVFLGHLRPIPELVHSAVLDDMDRLLPLYKYVESAGRAEPLPRGGVSGFVFRSGKNPKLLKTKATYSQQVLDVELRHNRLQEVLERQLKNEYGPDNVHKEVPCGRGKAIDLVVRQAGGYWYYDIKTFSSPRACVREAIGQLLEYSFWPGSQEACRLVVVGEAEPDEDVLEYCRRLKGRFSLPVDYERISL